MNSIRGPGDFYDYRQDEPTDEEMQAARAQRHADGRFTDAEWEAARRPDEHDEQEDDESL